MEKNEIQQLFGMFKFILILIACIIFVFSGVSLIDKTDWHTIYVMLLLLCIGVMLVCFVGVGLKIMWWFEDWIEGREKTTKEDRDSVEVKNVATEKKPSKVKELAKRMIPKKKEVPESNLPGKKVEFGGTPEAPLEEESII